MRPLYGASISTMVRATHDGVQNCPPFFPAALANCVRKYSETRPRMSLEQLASLPRPIVPKEETPPCRCRCCR